MTYTDKQRQAYLYFFNELRLCIEFPDCFIPKLKALMVLGFPIDMLNANHVALLQVNVLPLEKRQNHGIEEYS